MNPDELTIFALMLAVSMHLLYVTADNAVAVIRWANSRTSVTYRHISPNTLTRKLATS